MMRYEFAVDGMYCGNCGDAITTAVGGIDGVSGVTADSDPNTAILADNIENAGVTIA